MAENISEAIVDLLATGRVPSDQAVALAMQEVKKRASGGSVGKSLKEGEVAPTEGLIHSDVPGRTDKHPVNVPEGSYVIPADIVSALGEGNTMAGSAALDAMFGIQKNAGSSVEDGDGGPVPIIVAGGEYIVSPEKVTALGQGDIQKGHEILDKFVRNARAQLIETLKKLPGPKK